MQRRRNSLALSPDRRRLTYAPPAGDPADRSRAAAEFAPTPNSRFHQALALTLRRHREAQSKHKIIKRIKKYRSKLRTDDREARKAQKQRRRIAARRRRGEPEKAKDVIDKQHEQYALTYGMQIGVQMSVGRQYNTETTERVTSMRSLDNVVSSRLPISDYMAVDKYEFPLALRATAPASSSTRFKFKDYAPLVFRRLRNSWGVEKYEYLLSICPPDQGFINFISNSKSGQYFFFTHDMKYMIKTLSDEECKFLRRILPHYSNHMMRHPSSLINRYYGLHRVKMPHIRRKLHFVVMNNIFLTPHPIHTKYDLKGATYSGRYVSTAKIAAGPPGKPVRKDLNWLGFTDDSAPGQRKEGRAVGEVGGASAQPDPANRQWLKIGTPKRRLALAQQLGLDAVFLAEMKIMDYSLLVGVHGRDPAALAGYGLGKPEEDADVFEEEEESGDTGGSDEEGGKGDDAPTEARALVFDDTRATTSVFQREEGGFEGRNADGTRNNEIYYIGIIDILQQYNVRKFGENRFKTYFTKQGGKDISAQPPKEYAQRFLEFLASSIK